MISSQPIQLFPTCLLNDLYPKVGRAVVSVLESLGFHIEVPHGLTCCGQPAYNAGFWQEAKRVALYTLRVLDETRGAIVIPSGSCADMMIHQSLNLFHDSADELTLAKRVAGRCHEFSAFIAPHRDKLTRYGSDLTVTYHPSCHLSRGLKVRDEPLDLLKSAKGVSVKALNESESCCGFGGMFSIKQEQISSAMMNRKLSMVEDTGASCVVSCDLGCLMHLGGGLRRRGSNIEARHIAEVLAGAESSP